MIKYWVYNQTIDGFIESECQPCPVTPTILDCKKRLVFCHLHKTWEKISGIQDNAIKSECGTLMRKPFIKEYAEFIYGYEILNTGGIYYITVLSQISSTNGIKTSEQYMRIDPFKKEITCDGIFLRNIETAENILCKEVIDTIIDDIREKYKIKFGIKPETSTKLSGLTLLFAFIKCPYNLNFFMIAHYWDINTDDYNFTELSHGACPDAQSWMLKTMNITPTRKLKKMYIDEPKSIVYYAAAHFLGFTDVNLLQKSTSENFRFLIDYFTIRFPLEKTGSRMEGLKTFTKDMLEFNSQINVWNSLTKIARLYRSSDGIYVTDGIRLYSKSSPYITKKEKFMIMKQGFNRNIHDFLVNSYQDIFNKTIRRNVKFNIEQYYLDLESIIVSDCLQTANSDDGKWNFLVAKDSETLRTIGSQMHNCVASYTESVIKRLSTIIYATNKRKFKICIEIAPNMVIRQAYGPCNQKLSGDSLNIFNLWCHQKNLPPKKSPDS
ncbi:MAG: PcfJ domain-containing protein [Treponema sp.]|nr:PcfJ domain-containing protein [Treponema sp.]